MTYYDSTTKKKNVHFNVKKVKESIFKSKWLNYLCVIAWVFWRKIGKFLLNVGGVGGAIFGGIFGKSGQIEALGNFFV